MTYQPLTLKLLKQSKKYLPLEVEKAIQDENKVFTPEDLKDLGVDIPNIVQVTTSYLELIGKEHQARLLLCEITKPCVDMYAKYEPTKPNVLQNVIDVLKEEKIDKKKLFAAGRDAGDAARDAGAAAGAAGDAAWAAAWASARDAAWAAAWASARDAGDAARDAARELQFKLCVKFFNINVNIDIRKASDLETTVEYKRTNLEIMESIDSKLSKIIELLSKK